MNLLMTGATGFLGGQILEKLLPHFDKIFLLVRPQSLSKLEQKDLPLKCQLIECDLKEDFIIFNEKDKNQLERETDIILHCAAAYDLNFSYADSYFSNVLGSQNLINWSESFSQLKYFHFISTIAVSGEEEGSFKEESLNEYSRFSSGYSATKMAAESIFRKKNLGHVKKRIYRPGIIVGDSVHGDFLKIDGPYYFIKLIKELKQKLPILKRAPYVPLTYDPQAELPIIPIDVVANWISEMVLTPLDSFELRTYHLIPPHPLLVEDFLKMCLKWHEFDGKLVPIKKRKHFRLFCKMLGFPPSLVNYMYSGVQYHSDQLKNDYPHFYCPDFSIYQNAFFSGADNFFKEQY
jgi:thioester reductase-like protein